MAVTRHDLPALERAPEVVLDDVWRDVVADVGLHGELPAEDFLVCEAGETCASLKGGRVWGKTRNLPVKRTGETEQGSRVGEVRIREGRSDKV